MIYTAPCIMCWMRSYTLRGEVGGGWALEFPSFLGPVKWERADRRVSFGAQKRSYFHDSYEEWISYTFSLKYSLQLHLVQEYRPTVLLLSSWVPSRHLCRQLGPSHTGKKE
jgi:hypothetical protein